MGNGEKGTKLVVRRKKGRRGPLQQYLAWKSAGFLRFLDINSSMGYGQREKARGLIETSRANKF